MSNDSEEDAEDSPEAHAFADICLGLELRLGVSLDPADPSAQALKQQLKELASNLRVRPGEDSPELLGMRAFLVEWDAVAAAAPEVIADLRLRLCAGMILSDYLGVRAELGTAHAMVAGGITPRRGIPPAEPDLVVEDRCVGIEVTSRFTTSGRGDNGYKVLSAIREKSAEEYAGRHVALAIEHTSLMFDGGEVRSAELRGRIQAELDRSPFGAVIPWSVMYVHPIRALCRVIQRVDSPQIDTRLRSFLDVVFPEWHDRPPILVSVPRRP